MSLVSSDPAHLSHANRCPSRWLMAGIAALILVPQSGLAGAAEIEDIVFPGKVSSGKSDLPLYGLGLLRYKVLFRGYVGGLYLPAGARADQTLDDIPKALELYYFWDIEGQFFGDAAEEILVGTHPPEYIAVLRGRLDKLNALYRDVKVGDRYRLTYQPDRGLTLSYNGKDLGTIPGADFAEAYFGIWLGDTPLNESFRDQMFKGR